MTLNQILSENEIVSNFHKQTQNPMNPPQAVTTRYITTLLRDGRNDDFVLGTITLRVTEVDGVEVGTYFEASIEGYETITYAVGATPEQAVRRALEKHGVTFR